MTTATVQDLPRRASDPTFVERLRRGFLARYGDRLSDLDASDRMHVTSAIQPNASSLIAEINYIVLRSAVTRIKARLTGERINFIAGVAGSAESIRRSRPRDNDGSEGSRRSGRSSRRTRASV